MSNFISPWWLLALLIPLALVVTAVVTEVVQKQRFSARFPSTSVIDRIAPKRAGWRRWVVTALAALSLSALVVALARPQGNEKTKVEKATVILAIDVSLSMGADDVEPTRLEAAQTAATDFIESVPEQFNVGLVLFDGVARVQVSPTTDRSAAIAAINDTELGEGTAIGDAVTASVNAIEAFTSSAEQGDPEGTAPGAAVIVLSDGETTMGLPTADSALVAKEAGIPIWTIAYGTPGGQIELDDGTIASVPVVPGPLEDLANETDGRFVAADSIGDLEKAYSELGSIVGYEDQLVEIGHRWTLVGFILAVVAGALSVWWFRRLI